MESTNNHTRVAPTAWGVAYLRTFSDIPLADEFFTELNRQRQTLGEPDIATRASRDHLAPQLEARYKLVDSLLVNQGTSYVLELAAGIATHGINLTRDNPNLTYIEVDLPGVIAQKESILKKLNIDQPAGLSFTAGNVLNEDDIRGATASLPKDAQLTIVNEGLMRYLTFTEKTALAKIIHSLLSQYGGVWITPDISLGQTLARENAVANDHTTRLKQTTGIDIEQNVFDDKEQAQAFFEDLDFSVEVHSFLEVTGQLVSPIKLDMTDDDVKRLNEPCVAFVMRANNK